MFRRIFTVASLLFYSPRGTFFLILPGNPEHLPNLTLDIHMETLYKCVNIVQENESFKLVS